MTYTHLDFRQRCQINGYLLAGFNQIGKNHKQAVVSIVDRVSKFTILKKVPHKKAEDVQSSDLNDIMHKLNTRPRKTLGYQKPIDIFFEDILKVEKVFEEGVDIYFMSNTNELNVFKILSWRKSNFPDKVDLSLASPTIKQQEDLPVLQIGLGKHLVASYLGHTFKTAEDNTNAGVPNTTPTLLQAIIGNVFNNEVDNLTVVSQYPKDLEVARKLGIKDTSLAGDYFKPNQQSETLLLRS